MINESRMIDSEVALIVQNKWMAAALGLLWF